MNIFLKLILYLFVLLCFTSVFAQKSIIKTVQCYPSGNPFAEPVIELGSSQQLLLAFDDLSEEMNTYTYKIVHCDVDWNNSNLSPFTYLTGFFSNPVENYNYSFNTVVKYVHFTLSFPNENIGFKLSGNYILQVFNDNYPDTPVIRQRFSVLENRVMVNAQVVNCTNPQYLNTSQQVNFTVNYDNLPIYNPIRDARAYVYQNQDPNTRRSFTPTFVRQNQLVYGDGDNNVFNGLTSFRNFQSSSLVYYTQYVKDVIRNPEGIYNFILQPGTVYKNYTPQPDRDGNFIIQAENANNPNLEADYIIAHFAIYYPEPLPDADIYVYGKFSGWQFPVAQKMSYDDKNKAYVGQAELKQGYYDYMYAVLPNGAKVPNLAALQGNFYQTVNHYSIRFYIYDYNLGCFRFVGYKTIASAF